MYSAWCLVATISAVLSLTSAENSNKCPISSDITVLDIQRLRNDVFCQYDRLMKPRQDLKAAVNVSIGMTVKFIEVNSWSDEISIIFAFLVDWYDEFLTWDPQQYDQLEQMVIPVTNIWSPDLVIFNAKRTTHLLRHMSCVVLNTGHVSCLHYVRAQLMCTLTFQDWPADEHTCSMEVGSLTSVDKIWVQPSSQNLPWEVFSNKRWNLIKKTEEPGGQQLISWIHYSFTVRRNDSYHRTMLLICSLVPTLLMAGCFWLPRHKTRHGTSLRSVRLGICCVSFMLVALMMMHIGYVAPYSGENAPTIVLLYRNVMILSVISAILVTFHDFIAGLDDKSIPVWVTNIFQSSFMRTLLTETCQMTNKDVEAAEKLSTWLLIATLLDRITSVAIISLFVVMAVNYIPASK